MHEVEYIAKLSTLTTAITDDKRGPHRWKPYGYQDILLTESRNGLANRMDEAEDAKTKISRTKTKSELAMLR